MNRNTLLRNSFLLLFLGFALSAAGCAGSQAKPVTLASSQHSLTMEAGNFYFKPDVIKASPGTVLTISVHNVSGATHNLSIDDPRAKHWWTRICRPGPTKTSRSSWINREPIECIVKKHSIRPSG